MLIRVIRGRFFFLLISRLTTLNLYATSFMRLDQFLKSSRLVLRRSAAQELCDAGAVSVNDVPARSSRTVRAGDVLSILRGERLTRVRVLNIPATKQVARHDAQTLYELIAPDGSSATPAET